MEQFLTYPSQIFFFSSIPQYLYFVRQNFTTKKLRWKYNKHLTRYLISLLSEEKVYHQTQNQFPFLLVFNSWRGLTRSPQGDMVCTDWFLFLWFCEKYSFKWDEKEGTFIPSSGQKNFQRNFKEKRLSENWKV